MKNAISNERCLTRGWAAWTAKVRPRAQRHFVADFEVIAEVLPSPVFARVGRIGKSTSFSNAHMFTEPHFDFSL
jgi:hypothetical protein